MLFGSKFSSTDRERLDRRGITVPAAKEQLALLGNPPLPVSLRRACRPGEGITVLKPNRGADLESLWDLALPDLDVVKFVPASGAATRMFSFLREAFELLGDSKRAELKRMANRGSDAAGQALELAKRLGEMPFASALEEVAANRGIDPSELQGRPLRLGTLIAGTDGLGLASLPKGLIPFHRYGVEARTAFEEHLHEAAGYVRRQNGLVTLHFTVSPEHMEAFEEAAKRAKRAAAQATGAEFEVEFSLQDPSTDTLALANGTDLEPLRSSSGDLVFRPSGHGALITNLSRLDADVVFIKNIDNIAPARSHRETAAWKRRLGGHLLELRKRSFDLLDRLEQSEAQAAADALSFCRDSLALGLPSSIENESPESLRSFLIDRLDRPLRVCGVVENVGEPGGGPFWVAGPGAGESGQIVERSQVDLESAEQAEIFGSASHFNPVDLACSLRNRTGNAYDLSRFIDPGASFVTNKQYRGRTIRVLERPGLWNGAMAGWNTAFVEVPLATFTPVKTILDLSRPEHQA